MSVGVRSETGLDLDPSYKLFSFCGIGQVTENLQLLLKSATEKKESNNPPHEVLRRLNEIMHVKNLLEYLVHKKSKISFLIISVSDTSVMYVLYLLILLHPSEVNISLIFVILKTEARYLSKALLPVYVKAGT